MIKGGGIILDIWGWWVGATCGPRHTYASRSGVDLVTEGRVRSPTSEKVTGSNNCVRNMWRGCEKWITHDFSEVMSGCVNVTHTYSFRLLMPKPQIQRIIELRPWQTTRVVPGSLNKVSGWHVRSAWQNLIVFYVGYWRKAFTVIQNQRNSFVVLPKLRGRFSCKALKTLKQCFYCAISKLKCYCPDYPLIPMYAGGLTWQRRFRS